MNNKYVLAFREAVEKLEKDNIWNKLTNEDLSLLQYYLGKIYIIIRDLFKFYNQENYNEFFIKFEENFTDLKTYIKLIYKVLHENNTINKTFKEFKELSKDDIEILFDLYLDLFNLIYPDKNNLPMIVDTVNKIIKIL